MKLPQLLSQFLYQTKKLDLPGLGSFVLDPNAVIPAEPDKTHQALASGISFKNASIVNPDDALIQFIKDHTGKMKPLAASDLDFFLTTGKQLLNIGKPFYLEGIGTLSKNREGKLDFSPGEYSTAKLDVPGSEKKEKAEKRRSTFDEVPREHEPKSNSNANSNSVRQVLLLLGIIGGLIAIGWGGYYLYKKNTYAEPSAENQATVLKDTVQPDTTAAHTPGQPAGGANTPPTDTRNTHDSVSRKPATIASNPVSLPPVASTPAITVPRMGENIYKFVILETSNKGHALRRYNQLLGYQLNIKMDTKDSSYFKLYFPISAIVRDTTRIKDSLIDVYAARVRIEPGS